MEAATPHNILRCQFAVAPPSPQVIRFRRLSFLGHPMNKHQQPNFSFFLLLCPLLFVGESLAAPCKPTATTTACLGASCETLGSTTMDYGQRNIIACLYDQSNNKVWKSMSQSSAGGMGACYAMVPAGIYDSRRNLIGYGASSLDPLPSGVSPNDIATATQYSVTCKSGYSRSGCDGFSGGSPMMMATPITNGCSANCHQDGGDGYHSWCTNVITTCCKTN
jgi:hypothetical protein